MGGGMGVRVGVASLDATYQRATDNHAFSILLLASSRLETLDAP